GRPEAAGGRQRDHPVRSAVAGGGSQSGGDFRLTRITVAFFCHRGPPIAWGLTPVSPALTSDGGVQAASATPGRRGWRVRPPGRGMNPRSRSGRNFTSISESTTQSHNSSLSWAARFASRPYLVHPHTPSSGFRSGTYPGKSSTTTPGCSASHALTALARLWIW